MSYPRKKDWLKGCAQVGVFIRTKEGGTIELTQDRASRDAETFAFCLVAGVERLPLKLRVEVCKAYDLLVKQAQNQREESATRKTGK